MTLVYARGMYYVLDPKEDDDGNMMGLTYKSDHRGRSYVGGERFASDAENAWERPPAEPIQLTVKKGRETAPLPSYLPEPVPLMSKQLHGVLVAAGVDNLDVYRAVISFVDGRVASEDYFVFNLIGLVAAVDLAAAKFDRTQRDRHTSMSFDALAISPEPHGRPLMFRLAENVSTIIIHQSIKAAIEAANVPLIRALEPAQVALP